jgi:hypothetical protein
LERWFAADGGSQRGAGQWSAPLVARGLLAQPALDAFLRDVGRSPSTWQRELVALYALSRWIEPAA